LGIPLPIPKRRRNKMNAKTSQIGQLLERGMSPREIARVFDVSREWVNQVRHRYEARKYKHLYQELVEHLNSQEERAWNDSELIQP
jgi:transposase